MQERIGPEELAALLFGFMVGSSLVVPMGIQAKEASWLTLVLGGTAGLGVAWIYTALALRFPGQSLIGYSKRVLGRWLGGAAGLLYIWYGLHLGALVLRNFGEFLVSTILPYTPMGFVIVVLTAVCAYGVRHGAETLGRATQVMNAIVVTQVLLTTLLLAEKMRLDNLLPVFGDGFGPVLQGAFTTLSFPFGETVLFALLLPLVRPTRQIRPAIMRAMVVGALFLAMVHARNTAVLGAHLIQTSRFPTFGAAQAVEVADFITRIDAIVVGNWIVTGFIKVAVCLLAIARGFAEWTGVSEYRPLVLPLGAIMATLSILLYRNITEMSTFATAIWPVYSVPFQILMPILLLGIAAVRGLRA